MHGLFRRGGTWWARLVVPQRLRAAAGRREFWRSTRTHDLSVAKAVGAAILAQWRRQLLELERVDDGQLSKLIAGDPALLARPVLTIREAATYTGLSETDLLHEVARGGLTLLCRVPMSARHGHVMPRTALAPDVVPGGWVVPNEPPADAVPQDMGGKVLRLFDGGADVARAVIAEPCDEVDLVLLDALPLHAGNIWVPDCGVIRVGVGSLEVPATELERIRRSWVAAVSPERLAALELAKQPRVVTVVPAVPRNAGAWAGRAFSAVVADYCESPDGLQKDLDSPKEVRQRRDSMLRFVEQHGDKPIGEVTGDDLRQYRDWLATWPATMNNLPTRLKCKTVKETIATVAAELPDWPTMSEGMVAERFAWLTRLFGWLAQRGYLALNPAANLKGEGTLTKAERVERGRRAALDDAEEGRRPFSVDELGQVFGQPQFRTGHGRHVTGNQQCRPFEFWAPLLALLHGLRLSEAVQLWLDDIREVDGVTVLDVNDATPDKSLKNSTSRRLVPVHPLALDTGLLAYRDALRSAGFKRLFPELRWHGRDERYRKEPSRKFSQLLARLGHERDGTLTFHCLRHSANDAAARVPVAALGDMDEGLRVAARYKLLGHAMPDSDVNARHYLKVRVQELQRLVQSLRFDGLPEIARFDSVWGLEAVRHALARKAPPYRGIEDCGPAGITSTTSRDGAA